MPAIFPGCPSPGTRLFCAKFMKKILVPLFVLALLSCSPKMETVRLNVGGQEYTVEVARSSKDQQRGLMYRTSLGEKKGMLFVYEESRVLHFWMKNTLIPLTILFIGADGTIRDIQHMKAESEKTVDSLYPAKYALEVNLGEPEKFGIKVGDKVVFPDGFKK